jgi:hypothetical protein
MLKRAKRFKYWTSEEVENIFAVNRVYEFDLMKDWLGSKNVISESLREKLVYFKNELSRKIEYLNEDELKAHYLIPLLGAIGFDDFGKYRTSLNRKLSSEYEGMILSGEVDFMVATGKSAPKQPFFFLHEYKQELKRDNDPLGQLLIAMITAHSLNQENHPIYGCYVVGRLWFFVVYFNQTYCVSKSFDSSEEDIFDVASILLKNKEQIEKAFA